MYQVLIIDDDVEVNKTLSRVVERMHAEVTNAFTLGDGVRLAESGEFDVVFLDMRLPDGNGIDSLPSIINAQSKPEVIIITAYSDIDSAEMAFTHGAWDYLRKPASLDDVKLLLKRVFEYRSAKVVKQETVIFKREQILGQSPRLNATLERLAQAANGSMNVLLTGETGTGKELFARALHDNSSRADQNYVVLDCTVLPDFLIESILFGHLRGSFTGAERDRDGLVTLANGGTLFLDEIGELPLQVQKKLLRVLQEHQYRPVGSQKELYSDFRLVAATNRNLNEMVANGQFREDLLFRLRAFEIELPPLRERSEDIPTLVSHFITRFCEYNGIETKGFSPEFIDIMCRYNWPGNVRELLNTLEQVLAVSYQDPIMYPKHIPGNIRLQVNQFSNAPSTETPLSSQPEPSEAESSSSEEPIQHTFKEHHEAAEREYLSKLLTEVNGNISQASRISGLSRKHIYTLLNKYDIK